MVKILIQSIVFMTALMSLTSCAGISAGTGSVPELNYRIKVQEKFNFNIRSEVVRNELKTARLESMSSGMALETKILKKIAAVSKKEKLQEVFDTLWENDKLFQSVFNRLNNTEDSIPSLALIYYLLSASHGISWQQEKSEILYHDVLEKIGPHQLSGYSLHFYTLGLLNNGKYKAALPWIKRLKQYTSYQNHVDNLQTAYVMSEDGKDLETAIQLLSLICISKVQDKSKINEEKIDFTVISMIKNGAIHRLKDKISPMIRQFPELENVSFVRRIAGYEKPQNSSQKKSNSDVWLKVQVVMADHNTNYIDPELAPVSEELQSKLNYSGLKLLKTKVFHLNPGNKAEMAILPETHAGLLLLKANEIMSRIKITITKKEKEIFNTIIESIDGGITIIGGSRTKDNIILLRVTTYNEYRA